MRKNLLSLAAALACVAPAAHAYEAESYVSKCGFSMAIPAGHRAGVSESVGSDGLCRVDLTVEGVEFHAVTTKDQAVTLAETEKWVVRYTGVPAGHWSKFDEGARHIGYKVSHGGKTLWAAVERGSAFACIAFVRADSDEPVADLEQFYKSLSCK
jgi:hypothetical protein